MQKLECTLTCKKIYAKLILGACIYTIKDRIVFFLSSSAHHFSMNFSKLSSHPTFRHDYICEIVDAVCIYVLSLKLYFFS